ncbi:hypothetical protein BDF22DRAFT_668702 [Syncephalis plumigaleata]|nr:hypothetical protein BDF22DRAFT_668702 [Syncephalis plumigaleata]
MRNLPRITSGSWSSRARRGLLSTTAAIRLLTRRSFLSSSSRSLAVTERNTKPIVTAINESGSSSSGGNPSLNAISNVNDSQTTQREQTNNATAESFSIFPILLPVNAQWDPPFYGRSSTSIQNKTKTSKRNRAVKSRTLEPPLQLAARLRERLQNKGEIKGDEDMLASKNIKVKKVRHNTEARKAFTLLFKACQLLTQVNTSDLQTRMVDTIYGELREQYASNSALFSRLMAQLIHKCDRIDRVDLAESVFTRHHKHEGDVLISVKAIHAYTEMAVLLCRRRRFEQADTIFRVVEMGGAMLDVKAFNAAIIANARANNLPAAFSYVQRMIAAGWKPRSAPINALIVAHQPSDPSYDKRIQQLLTMLDQLASTPNGTLANANTFIPLLERASTLETLETYWSEILKRNLHGNPAIQRVFLNACVRVTINDATTNRNNVKNHDWRKTMSYWQTMLGRFEKRGVVSSDAYRTMLIAYAYKSNAIGARAMATRLAGIDQIWSRTSIHALLHAFGRWPSHWSVDGIMINNKEIAYAMHRHRARLWSTWNIIMKQRSNGLHADGYKSSSRIKVLAPHSFCLDMISALGRVNDVQGLRVIAGIDTWNTTGQLNNNNNNSNSTRDTRILLPLLATLQLDSGQLKDAPKRTILALVRALRGHPKDAFDICQLASPTIQADPALATALLDSLTMQAHHVHLRSFLLQLISWRNTLLQDADRLAGSLVRCLESLAVAVDHSTTDQASNETLKYNTRDNRDTMPPAYVARTLLVAREIASIISTISMDTDVNHAAHILDSHITRQF